MTAIAIRKRLYEYIRFADEKKIKAIYTIVEDEINENHDAWTKEFTQEMVRRAKDIETGKTEGKKWEAVQKKSRSLLRHKA